MNKLLTAASTFRFHLSGPLKAAAPFCAAFGPMRWGLSQDFYCNGIIILHGKAGASTGKSIRTETR
jgi:hypothetical protein